MIIIIVIAVDLEINSEKALIIQEKVELTLDHREIIYKIVIVKVVIAKDPSYLLRIILFKR